MLKVLEVVAAVVFAYSGAVLGLWTMILFSMRTPHHPMRHIDEEGREITAFNMATVYLRVPGTRRIERTLTYSPLALIGHATASLACFATAAWLTTKVFGG